ncbi:MAG: exodeoxyribonuclease VII small subunit [Anaerotruncus sp.]|nr:exodeoxyribonuclease VII small subunit [Anaerotruncus sp.]
MGKPTTLEAAMKRLEEITNLMDGELSIDDSIKLYAEAVKLIELATGRLENAKLKVEKLTAQKEESSDEAK